MGVGSSVSLFLNFLSLFVFIFCECRFSVIFTLSPVASLENSNAKELALLIKNFTDYIEQFEKHSDRIVSSRIKLHGKTSLQIIQVYACSDHDNETLEMF